MFQKASKVKKNLKVLVYGPSGSGKTHFALTFPRPAVVDLEGGTDLFGNRFDFDVLHTKEYDEVIAAVEEVAANPAKYETLVIDPVTVLWQVIMEAGQMMAEARAKRNRRDPNEAVLTPRDWGMVKRRVNALYTRLVNMPCHVVVVGRIKDVNETRGNEVVKVGEKPDAEKSTEYLFDVVIKLTVENGKRIGIVEKDRSGQLQGKRIQDPTFAVFSTILDATKEGAVIEHTNPDAAAETLAKELEKEAGQPPEPRAPHWIDDQNVRRRFWAWTRNTLGLTDDEVHTALGVDHIPDYPGTMQDAKTVIEAWVNEQNDRAADDNLVMSEPVEAAQ